MHERNDGDFETQAEDVPSASNTIDIALDLDTSATLAGPSLASEAEASSTHPSPAHAASTTAPSGDQLGRYKLLGLLGTGGMGEVWRVWDPALRREVALKVMRKGTEHATRRLARFVAEAQATAQLQHPGVVPVYDSGELPDGRPYYTMKVIEGRTLAELVESLHGRTTPERWGCTPEGRTVLDLVGSLHAVCEALAYAHQRGAIHRDIKPANILVGHFGEVLLVDWGLVKIVGESIDSTDAGLVQTDQSTQPELATRFGAVAGTRGFMPPEQEDGRVHLIGPSSDVYALGAVLSFILTGSVPRAPERLEAILTQLPRVDPELRQLCLEAMAPEQAARPAHAGILAERLGAWLQGARAEARAAASVRLAETAFSTLSAEDQRWLRIWCLRIMHPDGGVHPVAAAPEKHPELERLFETGILVDGEAGVSFADPDLVETWTRLGTWLVEHAEQHRALHALSSAAREWMRSDRPRRLLWVDQSAVSGNGGTAALLGEPALSFLEASRSHLRAQRRRRRVLTAAVILLLSLSTALSLVQWNRALQAQKDEKTARLEAEARSFLQQAHRMLAEESPHAAVAHFSAANRLRASPSREAAETIASIEPMRAYTGHSGEVKATAWSPDGRRVASGSVDQTVQIWSAETGETLHTLEHPTGVRRVTWSEDGRYLATCGLDGTIRTWDATSGAFLQDLPVDNAWVSALRFLKNGRLLVAEPGGRLKTYDPASGAVVTTMEGHSHYVFASDETSDGRWLATASVDQTVRVWDLLDGSLHQTLHHPVQLLHVVVSSDGSRVAAAGVEDARVWLWDRATGAQVGVLQTQQGSVTSIDMSPDGQVLAMGAKQSTVQLWSTQTGAPIEVSEPFRGDASIDVRFSPDGSELAVSTTVEGVVFIDANTGAIRSRRAPSASVLRTLRWSADGSAVLTGNRDGTVMVYQRTDVPRMESQRCGHGTIMAAMLSPNRRYLGLNFAKGGLCLVSLDSGEAVQLTERGSNFLAWGPESRWIGSSQLPSDDQKIQVFDRLTGVVREFLVDEPIVNGIHITSDGRSLWAATRNNELVRASMDAGELVGRISLPRRPLIAEFAGDHAVVLYHDRTAEVWNLSTSAPVAADPRDDVEPAARGLDPSGRFVVWESEPGMLQRTSLDSSPGWTTAIGEQPKSVVVDQSGRWVVVNDGKQTLRIHAAHSGVLVGTLPVDGRSGTVEFSPTGERLLIRDDSGIVRVFRVRDLVLLDVFELGPGATIQSAAFVSDNALVTVSEDLVTRTWRLPDAPTEAGTLSNLRPCRDGTLVAIQPWPDVGEVWAPSTRCGGPSSTQP